MKKKTKARRKSNKNSTRKTNYLLSIPGMKRSIRKGLKTPVSKLTYSSWGAQAPSPKKPNWKTKKVFKNTDRGRCLNKAKNSKDMFRKLGI